MRAVTPDFDAVTLEQLRRRTSIKWRTYPADVLPAWVAELDVPLAPAVTDVLRAAVEDGDTGYAAPQGLAAAFAGFAARRWGWPARPERCLPVPDVMVGVGEALTALTGPGDGVVVCPPVYAPFLRVPTERGRRVVEVPLAPGGDLDLTGIDRVLRAGQATAVLLCNPHNPTGRVWRATELDALHEVARASGALVVSDEIHAPLTLPGATFSPYLSRGDRHAVAVVSASKAFNLAGLKAALVVAGSDAVHDRLAALPPDVAYRTGHLGVLAGVAAYGQGDGWLDALLEHLAATRALTGELLAELLPQVSWCPPQASYLAWLDCRALGPDPAGRFLSVGRVAVVDGAEYGGPGRGFVRLNIGTTRPLVREALRRMSRAVAGCGEVTG